MHSINNKYQSHFSVSITHVADKAQCKGGGKEYGFVKLETCARLCVHLSEMFAFGTTKFGSNKCDTKGDSCKCNCMDETTNYKCNERVADPAFILYAVKFTAPGI